MLCALDSPTTQHPTPSTRAPAWQRVGRGPHNRSRGSITSTKTDFENVFESAGINQTQHSIMLNVETTVILTLSGRRVTQTVETSFCVAQTVIIGSVPEIMVNK